MGYDPTGEDDWQEIANFGIAIIIIGLAIMASPPTGGGSLVLAGVAVSATTVTAAGAATAATGLAVTGSALVYAASNNSSNSGNNKKNTEVGYSTRYSGSSKFAKNGVRIDYEYYGNRAGNVHITYKGIKYMLFSISQTGVPYYYSGPTVVKGVRLITDEVSKYVSKYIHTVLELGGW